MKVVISKKIWVEYILLFGQKSIRCQSLYQLQNLKILLTIWGNENPHGQNFEI